MGFVPLHKGQEKWLGEQKDFFATFAWRGIVRDFLRGQTVFVEGSLAAEFGVMEETYAIYEFDNNVRVQFASHVRREKVGIVPYPWTPQDQERTVVAGKTVIVFWHCEAPVEEQHWRKSDYPHRLSEATKG